MKSAFDSLSEDRPVVMQCPCCTAAALKPLHQLKNQTVVVCETCMLQIQTPQPSERRLSEIYSSDYFISDKSDPDFAKLVETLKRGTAQLQIEDIVSYLKRQGRSLAGLKLLEIGPGHGYFLKEAEASGAEIHGLEYSVDAASKSNAYLQSEAVQVGSADLSLISVNTYDVIVLCDVIEHVRNPVAVLTDCWRALKKDGIIFIATVDTNSLSARLMKSHWMEYKEEHLFYFNAQNLAKALSIAGFKEAKSSRGTKKLSLSYIIGHFVKFPIPLVSPVMGLLRKTLPQSLLTRPFSVVASGFNIIAAKEG